MTGRRRGRAQTRPDWQGRLAADVDLLSTSAVSAAPAALGRELAKSPPKSPLPASAASSASLPPAASSAGVSPAGGAAGSGSGSGPTTAASSSAPSRPFCCTASVSASAALSLASPLAASSGRSCAPALGLRVPLSRCSSMGSSGMYVCRSVGRWRAAASLAGSAAMSHRIAMTSIASFGGRHRRGSLEAGSSVLGPGLFDDSVARHSPAGSVEPRQNAPHARSAAASCWPKCIRPLQSAARMVCRTVRQPLGTGALALSPTCSAVSARRSRRPSASLIRDVIAAGLFRCAVGGERSTSTDAPG